MGASLSEWGAFCCDEPPTRVGSFCRNGVVAMEELLQLKLSWRLLFCDGIVAMELRPCNGDFSKWWLKGFHNGGRKA